MNLFKSRYADQIDNSKNQQLLSVDDILTTLHGEVGLSRCVITGCIKWIGKKRDWTIKFVRMLGGNRDMLSIKK